jgi:integrase
MTEKRKPRRAAGTGSVFKMGGVWKVRYAVDGKRVQESHRFRRKVDAVKLLKRRLGEIEDGRYTGPDTKRVTFAELMEAGEAYLKDLKYGPVALGVLRKHVERHLGMFRVSQLTYNRLMAYKTAREDEGAAPGTIRFELAVLRRAMKELVLGGKMPALPPFPTISVQNARTGFFERAELDAVCRELTLPLELVVRFMYFTGWRKSEVLTREWRHVDFNAGVIRLEPGETKNKEGRTFPFAALPGLRDVLERARAYTDEVQHRRGVVIPWVFHREGKPVRRFGVAWRGACDRAEIGHKLVHDFRRSAVRNLERASVPRSQAMALVGHRSETMYRRYAITCERDQRDAVTRLAALHEQEDGKILPIEGTVKAQLAGGVR